MSSNVVFDLKAAIGSLNDVSSGSFLPTFNAGEVVGFWDAVDGFWTATESAGDSENIRALFLASIDKYMLVAVDELVFPRIRTNAIFSLHLKAIKTDAPRDTFKRNRFTIPRREALIAFYAKVCNYTLVYADFHDETDTTENFDRLPFRVWQHRVPLSFEPTVQPVISDAKQNHIWFGKNLHSIHYDVQ